MYVHTSHGIDYITDNYRRVCDADDDTSTVHLFPWLQWNQNYMSHASLFSDDVRKRGSRGVAARKGLAAGELRI